MNRVAHVRCCLHFLTTIFRYYFWSKNKNNHSISLSRHSGNKTQLFAYDSKLYTYKIKQNVGLTCQAKLSQLRCQFWLRVPPSKCSSGQADYPNRLGTYFEENLLPIFSFFWQNLSKYAVFLSFYFQTTFSISTHGFWSCALGTI